MFCVYHVWWCTCGASKCCFGWFRQFVGWLVKCVIFVAQFDHAVCSVRSAHTWALHFCMIRLGCAEWSSQSMRSIMCVELSTHFHPYYNDCNTASPPLWWPLFFCSSFLETFILSADLHRLSLHHTGALCGALHSRVCERVTCFTWSTSSLRLKRSAIVPTHSIRMKSLLFLHCQE